MDVGKAVEGAFHASLPLLISSSIHFCVSCSRSAENVSDSGIRSLPFAKNRAAPAQKFIPWQKNVSKSRMWLYMSGPGLHYKQPGMENPFANQHKSSGEFLAGISTFRLNSCGDRRQPKPAGPHTGGLRDDTLEKDAARAAAE
jgi:hypothetical protein